MTTKRSPRITSEEIAEDTKAFLKNGGRIYKARQGETAVPVKPIKKRAWVVKEKGQKSI